VERDNTMKTVLVFEPDNTLKTLYKEELEEEGYHVCFPKDASEAVAILKKTPVNILITEHQIEPTETYTNLLDLAREVKQIPVIIFTCHPPSLIDFEWWDEMEYVSKTSNLDVLKEMIREMLDDRCCIDRCSRGLTHLKQHEFYF
jgi:DNA-binding NtrC family response regulator